jgi:hypothetical protein
MFWGIAAAEPCPNLEVWSPRRGVDRTDGQRRCGLKGADRTAWQRRCRLEVEAETTEAGVRGEDEGGCPR